MRRYQGWDVVKGKLVRRHAMLSALAPEGQAVLFDLSVPVPL
jgi:hypothetical protein